MHIDLSEKGPETLIARHMMRKGDTQNDKHLAQAESFLRSVGDMVDAMANT